MASPNVDARVNGECVLSSGGIRAATDRFAPATAPAMARSCSRAKVTATCAPGARIASSALCDAKGEREESGRQRNGRGGSVGRSAQIVSRLRIGISGTGEDRSGCVRGTPGPRAARGSGLGTHRDHGHLQHLRRDVRERPSKVLVTRRQRLLERVLHGAPLPLPATTVRLQCTAGAS